MDNSSSPTPQSPATPPTLLVTTQIKYNKTSCYFCNEWLENGSFEKHLKSCGQSLMRCPNDCTAYVQRKLLEEHLKGCPRSTPSIEEEQNFKEDNPDPIEIDDPLVLSDPSLIPLTKRNLNSVDQRLMILEQDINAVRSALNEEARQRHRLIIDVGTLRKRNVIADEWTSKVGEVLTAFKKCLNEETESRCIDINQTKVEIGRLVLQYQEINDWRLEMQMQIDQLEKDVIPDEKIRNYIDVLIKDNRISAMKIYGLENDVKLLKQRSVDAHRISGSNDALILEKMSEIDQFLVEYRQKTETSTLLDNVELRNSSVSDNMQSSSTLNELNHKLTTLDFELKSMKHIVTDTEDKCDRLGALVTQTKNTTHHTKQLLNDLDVHLRHQKHLGAIHNIRGHLLWRVDDFAARLLDAKENDVTIHSPMFCHRQYGYTLRLDVSLNGIGTWKGRNIIAGLAIVPGEWDPLLVWPCKLQADIILRDQPHELSEAMDITKTIFVKRKSETYEQNQNIFIPHKTINTRNYLRNDAIFFEVKVHRNSL